jgi:hypothetical protein
MKNTTSFLSILILVLVSCNSIDQYLVWVDSNCDSLPNIKFDIKQIYLGMEDMTNDSLWNKYWKAEHDQQMAILNKVSNDSFALYPYKKVDSALFYFYEVGSKEDEPLDFDSRQLKDVSLLSSDKTKLLLNVINNPLNFGTGECGTDIPFSKIVLFNKGQVIGDVNFGCNYTMIITPPSNPMITGGLADQGDSLLTSIKLWQSTSFFT